MWTRRARASCSVPRRARLSLAIDDLPKGDFHAKRAALFTPIARVGYNVWFHFYIKRRVFGAGGEAV